MGKESKLSQPGTKSNFKNCLFTVKSCLSTVNIIILVHDCGRNFHDYTGRLTNDQQQIIQYRSTDVQRRNFVPRYILSWNFFTPPNLFHDRFWVRISSLHKLHLLNFSIHTKTFSTGISIWWLLVLVDVSCRVLQYLVLSKMMWVCNLFLFLILFRSKRI